MARNEDRDQLLTDSIVEVTQIKVQSVASLAGATATARIVNQPVNGHLNAGQLIHLTRKNAMRGAQ